MHSPHHRLFSRILDTISDGEIAVVRALDAQFDAPIDPKDPSRRDAAFGAAP